MDRREWLAERRNSVVAAYDAMAGTYEEYPNEAQQEWVSRLLGTCVPGDVVLDAPCGTGRYFASVVEARMQVVGLDQSAGMLAQADARGTATALHHIGLQEMAFVDEFDAVMTIDAMENVSPEDWPVVLGNLARALRRGGQLYMTVEETAQDKIDMAYERLVKQGQPAIHGEVVATGQVAGYHHYPRREQVSVWLDQTGWSIIDEEYIPEDGWAYRHLLLQHDPAR